MKITVPMPRDEKTKELRRELAKLNPEDPRAELWKSLTTKDTKDHEGLRGTSCPSWLSIENG